MGIRKFPILPFRNLSSTTDSSLRKERSQLYPVETKVVGHRGSLNKNYPLLSNFGRA